VGGNNFSFPSTPSPSPPRSRKQLPLRVFGGLKPSVPASSSVPPPSSANSSSRSLNGEVGASGSEGDDKDNEGEGDDDAATFANLKAAAATSVPSFATSPPRAAVAVALPPSPFKAAATASFAPAPAAVVSTQLLLQQQQQQQEASTTRSGERKKTLLRRNACLAAAGLCLVVAHARLLSSLAAAVAADPRPYLGTVAAVVLVFLSGALDDVKRGSLAAARSLFQRLRALSRSPAAAAPLSVARRFVAIIDGLGLLPVLLARLETELACVRADIYSIRLKADWLPDRKRKAAQHDPADAALPPMSAPVQNVSVQTLARRAERAAAASSSSSGGLGSALAAAAAASVAKRAFASAGSAAADED